MKMSDDIDSNISLNINISSKISSQLDSRNRIKGNRGQRIKARKSLKEFKKKHGTSYVPEHQSAEHDNSVTQSVQGEESRKLTEYNTEQKLEKHKKSGIVISSLFSHNPDIPAVKSCHVTQVKEDLFSSDCFQDAPLHPYMKSNLEKLGFTKMTAVQHQTIPLLVSGRDLLVKSQTGSGKTMAYVIPIVEKLCTLSPKLKRSDGCLAIIIVPTRELALQSYDVFVKLLKPFTWLVPGCIMGGEKRKAEKARLRKGINILVATPGRLLDHIENTQSLLLDKIKWLVLDEADRLLDLGFEEKVSKIVQAINKQSLERQTVLLSATLSQGVEKLAGMSLNNPQKVSITESSPDNPLSVKSSSNASGKHHTTVEDLSKQENKEVFALPKSLKQYFVVTPCKLRLVVLLTLILTKCKRELQKKMIVFTSTQDGVEFLYRLVQHLSKYPSTGSDVEDSDSENRTSLDVYHLHGDMTQKDRTATFHDFCSAKSGVMLCTDVAARGLHLPFVQWVIQYTCPAGVTEYVHRVGRTARAGTTGSTVMFLLPSEIEFVQHLNGNNISIEELKLGMVLEDVTKLLPSLPGVEETQRQAPRTVEEAATYLQNCCELYVKNGNDMDSLAKRAFQSTIRAYATYPHNLKSVFQIRNLHLGHTAKTFGLREAPSHIGHVSGLNSGSRKRKHTEQDHRSKMKMKKLDTVSEYKSPLVFTKDKKVSNRKRQKNVKKRH